MEQKRKAQPQNLKRYWLIFGMLAIVLLIPFRLVGYWEITSYIYISISVIIGFVLVKFVRNYGWKHNVVVLMLVCMMLPIFQANQTPRDGFCDDISIKTYFHCGHVVILQCEFMGIQNTSIGIQQIPHPYQLHESFLCTSEYIVN